MIHLETLGGLAVLSNNGVVVGGGFGGEEEVVLLEVSAEDLGGGFVGKLVDESELLELDEAGEGVFAFTVEVSAFVIEL